MAITIRRIETTDGNVLRKRQDTYEYNGNTVKREYWQEKNSKKHDNNGFNRIKEEEVTPQKIGGYSSNSVDVGLANDGQEGEEIKDTTPEGTGGNTTIEKSILLSKDENQISVGDYKKSKVDERKQEMTVTHNTYGQGYDEMNVKIEYTVLEEQNGKTVVKDRNAIRRTKNRLVDGELRVLLRDYEDVVEDIEDIEDDYERVEIDKTQMAFIDFGR